MDEELRRYRIDVAARWLERVRALGIRVRVLESEIAELRADAEGLGAMDYTRERVSMSAPGDRMADIAARIFERLDDLVDERREYEGERARARGCIDALENPMHRDVLVMRFLNGERWSAIADALGVKLPTVYAWRRDALDALFDVMPAQEKDAIPRADA